ncbi:MAG: chromosomal replication initiator protein DnaA [Candidatus Nealsonbacteria bacterium]|nr:chromosomal replication initiator protein DnaA [Candidatus Nealsonbacteria bacterium]
MDKQELWRAVLAQIQFNISAANFATWFKNTSIVAKENGEVMVAVPNSFSKEWLENKYNKLILKILRELEENVKEVKYTTAGSALKVRQEPLAETQPEIQLEFQEFRVDKATNLNPKYNFDNFVVGPFNELSYAAATAIAKNPGTAYNPLFIYGGVGLGKTHLLQAIGNQILADIPEKKVKYLPAEKFISAIVKAIKEQSIEKLKTAWQDIDVLIIDDVQFFAGKEKTQEEFFHLFNALYQKNKQIILSSDRPPKAIPAIEERLRSRFEGGMIADIGYPDFETRVAILKSKAQEKKMELSNDILEYISSHIQRNVRELEGALNRISAHQNISKTQITLDEIKEVLKSVISSPVKTTNFKKIVQAVTEFYGLSEKDVLGKSRKKEIVRARQISMFLLRTELKNSFPDIGRKFTGKDHTTAIHSFNKIRKETETEERLNEEINLIKQRVYI